jgi:2-dehydro-3-deoxygluconokinase
VQAARAAGLRVSIDLNFRKKLWNYGAKAPDVMRGLVRLADVLIANEEDIQLGLGLKADTDPEASRITASAYQALAARTKAEYANLDVVAITLRESLSADRNGWSAVLDGRDGFRQSRKYALEDIVDRVGGGDAFAAGLIFGLLEYGDEGRALDYAVAASALKHSVPGDINLSTRDEVERLAGGDGSGRVQR